MRIKDLKRNKRGRDFFLYDAVTVAKNILGDYLVVRFIGEDSSRKFNKVDKRGVRLVGKIVEVESYLGIKDDASHSFDGRITRRNRIMYEPGGTIYTYLIYGKYWCFNIVVSGRDDPQAVFIRALEPVLGIDKMVENRKTGDIRKLTSGPCRWTAAFGIDKGFLGRSILSSQVYISYNPVKNFQIVEAKRVGVDYAVRSRNLLLRFYLKDNPYVSKK